MDNYANTSGTFGAHYHIHAQTWINSQNAAANTSSIHLRVYLAVDSGYSWSGLSYFNAQGRINGGQVASGGFPGSGSGPGTWIAIDWDGTVGHDVNGNWSGSAGASTQASYSGIGSGGGDWGWSLPRLALAPSIAYVGVNAVKSSTANFYTEANDYGHGTSAACRIYYGLHGSGIYTATADQGDVAGNNNFPVTGLKPGTSYDYYVLWYNNNGDVSTSGVQTFKTQSVPGMIPVLMAVM